MLLLEIGIRLFESFLIQGFAVKKLYLVLAWVCVGWAIWSLIRFLFLAPSDTGNHSGISWLVSIFIEAVLANIFFSLAKER